MSLIVGNVVIDQVTGGETITPGWAATLYANRKNASRLPDPTNPKGCTVTAQADPTDTTIEVDSSAGYLVGDTLGSVDYVNPTPVGGVYVPAEVTLVITAIPDGTHVTVSPALPTGCSIKVDTKFGFTGSPSEWTALATKQVVKIRTQMAAIAVADAEALVAEAPLATSVALSANAAGTTLTSAQNTNLLFAAEAGVTYNVCVEGQVTCSGVGGVKVGINAPGGSTLIAGEAAGAGASDTTWTSAILSALGTPVGAFSAAVGGNRRFRLSATVTVGTSGNVVFQYASVTNGQTSNVIAGTRMTAYPVSLV